MPRRIARSARPRALAARLALAAALAAVGAAAGGLLAPGRAAAQDAPPEPAAPRPLYLDQATVDAAGGLVHLERPDEEWVFIDVDVQRAERMRERPAAEVEAAFRGVSARLHHPGLKATLSVYAYDLPPGYDLAAAEADVRRDLAARGARVYELARGQLGARGVVKADYALEPKAEGGAPPPDPLFVVRIDCPRADQGKLIVLLFEIPKDKRRTGTQELKAILKAMRW